jgi:hypothetical protein
MSTCVPAARTWGTRKSDRTKALEGTSQPFRRGGDRRLDCIRMYVRTVVKGERSFSETLALKAVEGLALPLRVSQWRLTRPCGRMLGHPRPPPGELHEGCHLHRDFNPGVAQLGLWRRGFGKPLAITGHAVYAEHADYTKNAIGVVAVDCAGVHVDWHGEHAAICGDGSAFGRQHEGYEQFGGVEFFGCERRVDQRQRFGQRRCGRLGNDQRAIRNSSWIGDARGNCGSRQSEVDHDIAGSFVHGGQYQPAIHGDRCLQRWQQF